MQNNSLPHPHDSKLGDTQQRLVILEHYATAKYAKLDEQQRKEVLAALWEDFIKKNSEREIPAKSFIILCQVQAEKLRHNLENSNNQTAGHISQTALQESFNTCLLEQKKYQRIAVQERRVTHNNNFYSYTADDHFRELNTLWSKYQIARSDYTDYVLPVPIDNPTAEDYNAVIRASVFDPDLLPRELIDFVMRGSHQKWYTHTHTTDLKYYAAQHMTAIKDMLVQAQKLSYAHGSKVSANITHRIIKLVHPTTGSIAYMVSENSDMKPAEKEFRKYVIPHIRFKVYTDKNGILNHLQKQIPTFDNKIQLYTGIQDRILHLGEPRDIYVQNYDESDKSKFLEGLAEIKDSMYGYSMYEVERQETYDKMTWVNRSTDQVLFVKLKGLIAKILGTQESMKKYTEEHIESLKRDSDF